MAGNVTAGSWPSGSNRTSRTKPCFGQTIYEKLFSGQLVKFEFTLNDINSDIKKLSFILIRHDNSVIMLLKLLIYSNI